MKTLSSIRKTVILVEDSAIDNDHVIPSTRASDSLATNNKKNASPIPVTTNEVLTKGTPLSTWISDFVSSKNSRFAGKSKEERIKMANGAYYSAQKESTQVQEDMGAGVNSDEADEISLTRAELDDIADVADDLWVRTEGIDSIPPWVQHKVAGLHAELRSVHDYFSRMSENK